MKYQQQTILLIFQYELNGQTIKDNTIQNHNQYKYFFKYIFLIIYIFELYKTSNFEKKTYTKTRQCFAK